MRHLEIMPARPQHGTGWVFRYEDDTDIIGRADTLPEAETLARAHAREFGVNVIHVFEHDGDRREIALEPDRQAPTPKDVKGPAAF